VYSTLSRDHFSAESGVPFRCNPFGDLAQPMWRVREVQRDLAQISGNRRTLPRLSPNCRDWRDYLRGEDFWSRLRSRPAQTRSGFATKARAAHRPIPSGQPARRASPRQMTFWQPIRSAIAPRRRRVSRPRRPRSRECGLCRTALPRVHLFDQDRAFRLHQPRSMVSEERMPPSVLTAPIFRRGRRRMPSGRLRIGACPHALDS
jgi:hypothetical protein